MVVVVVGMKEEMEENEVVVLVVKMEGKMVEKWVAKGGSKSSFHGSHFVGCWLQKKEERKSEREKKKWGWFYNGGKNIIILA